MASAKDSDDVRARLGQLRRYLEKRYGISIVDLNRLDRGVYRVDRKEGQSWVARVFPAERSVDQAEGDDDVLRFLEQHRFPAERCARPDPVSAPGGRAVLLTDYIEGTTAGRSEATLFKMGEMLGRLNVLPAGSGGVSREAGALHHYSLRGGLLERSSTPRRPGSKRLKRRYRRQTGLRTTLCVSSSPAPTTATACPRRSSTPIRSPRTSLSAANLSSS